MSFRKCVSPILLLPIVSVACGHRDFNAEPSPGHSTDAAVLAHTSPPPSPPVVLHVSPPPSPPADLHVSPPPSPPVDLHVSPPPPIADTRSVFERFAKAGLKEEHYRVGKLENGRYKIAKKHPLAVTGKRAGKVIDIVNSALPAGAIALDSFSIYERPASDNYKTNNTPSAFGNHWRDITSVSPPASATKSKITNLFFWSLDTVDAASRLADEFLGGDTSKVAIVDQADANLAGAGPLFYTDAPTQEEAIGRVTDLFIRLNWIQDRYQNGFFDLPELGTIFLRDVNMVGEWHGGDTYDERYVHAEKRPTVQVIAASLYDYQLTGNIPAGMQNYVFKDLSRGIERKSAGKGAGAEFIYKHPLGGGVPQIVEIRVTANIGLRSFG